MDVRQLREKGLHCTQVGEGLGIDPRTAAKYCGDMPPAILPRMMTGGLEPADVNAVK
jgi:hypothetical protein